MDKAVSYINKSLYVLLSLSYDNFKNIWKKFVKIISWTLIQV